MARCQREPQTSKLTESEFSQLYNMYHDPLARANGSALSASEGLLCLSESVPSVQPQYANDEDIIRTIGLFGS